MSFLKKIFSSSKEEFREPEVLLEEQSPLCPITAIVEQDNRVVYLYLWGPESSHFGTKSCWVRNLKEAPEKTNTREVKKGIPPMLEREFCKYPEGQPAFNKEDLHLVWLEEGDGVVLMEKTEVLAIIPSWSGHSGFFGYARDCIGQSVVCWELNADNEMLQRFEESKQFIETWDSEPDPFQIQQPFLLDLYEEALGKHDKYYAIDNGEWPPRGLYTRNGPEKTICLTVGQSLIPQPMVEMYVEDRTAHNRIEIGLMVNGKFEEGDLDELASWVSGQANIPWENITFLGEGHTINLSFKPSLNMTAVILTSQLTILPEIDLGSFRGSKIRLLWMVPITTKERQHVMDHGSEELLEKLEGIGDGIYDLSRAELF